VLITLASGVFCPSLAGPRRAEGAVSGKDSVRKSWSRQPRVTQATAGPSRTRSRCALRARIRRRMA